MELLVVIGIIAVLISVLLPALAASRRAARTIQCAANIRSILQAMTMYVSENRGWIPGSPNTSSYFLYTVGSPTNFKANYCPTISQIWDWQSPIATEMGIAFDTGATNAHLINRYNYLISQQVFTCPENTYLATPYAGTGSGDISSSVVAGTTTQPMSSYFTAECFLQAGTANNPAGGGAGTPQAAAQLAQPTVYSLPPSYVPKITMVGDTSTKVYIADGARYVRAGNSAPTPTYDLYWTAKDGGAYSDFGPWEIGDSCWNRQAVPANAGQSLPPGIGAPSAGAPDGRLFGFRHGIRIGYEAADMYKFNVGFFDGHVELLGDLQGANPAYWLPTGASATAGVPCSDVCATYNIPTSSIWYSP